MDHRCHHKLYCHSTSPCVGGTLRVCLREGEEAGAEGGVETEAQAVRDSELRGKKEKSNFYMCDLIFLGVTCYCVLPLLQNHLDFFKPFVLSDF